MLGKIGLLLLGMALTFCLVFSSSMSIAGSVAEVDAQNNVLLAIMAECNSIYRLLQSTNSQPEKDAQSIRLGQCMIRMEKQRDRLAEAARAAGMTVPNTK